MARFIAIVDTPAQKHKMVILPIFETIEEAKREAMSIATSFPIKILDIDWDIEKQQRQNNLIAELKLEVSTLKEELGWALNKQTF